MKKILALTLALVLVLGCMAACGGTKDPDATEPEGTKGAEGTTPVANDFKVALICLHGDSSTYDKNFIDAFKAACANKGIAEENYMIVTDIPEGVECYDQAASFADDGFNLVFADSFGHESYMMQAAQEFPEVRFCHATGTQAHTAGLANFSDAFASIYEGRYLAGVAAGMKLVELYGDEEGKVSDENCKIGYVGAWPYAEVISGYTSFYLGVKSVVENVTMEVRYTNSWYDETTEKTTALALIDAGCKLISQHADSMGAPTACEERNIPNVSYNGSTAEACPNTFIVASRINWTPYFEYAIDCAMNGKDIEADWTGTIGTESVVLTEVGPAAAAGTAEKLEEIKAELVAGTRKVFDCANFTVTVDPEAKDSFGNVINGNATIDGVEGSAITEKTSGHVTAYMADVDGDYAPDTNVVHDGFFDESGAAFRSAPYFDIIVDGITVK